MRNRRLAACFCLSAAAIAFASQAKVNYRDESFELRGFSTFSADLVSGGIAFQGEGAPAEVVATKSRMSVSGRQVKGEAKRGQDRAYFVSSLDVTGNAAVTMAAVPPDAGSTSIKTESLVYGGTASDGKLDLPSEFQLDSKASGSIAATASANVVEFDQTMHFAGSKGTIHLAMAAKPKGMTLRKGDVSGPVTFSITRNETLTGAALQTSKLSGKADALSFDFTPESRLVLLKGNVLIEGAGPVVSGSLEAETVRLFLDESYNVLRVEVTGNPATTRFRDQRPSEQPK